MKARYGFDVVGICSNSARRHNMASVSVFTGLVANHSNLIQNTFAIVFETAQIRICHRILQPLIHI